CNSNHLFHNLSRSVWEMVASTVCNHLLGIYGKGEIIMLNRVILIGRLTRDPELRYTPAGIACTQFTLAVDRQFKSDGQPDADFIPIVTWRQTAEACANYLRK